LTAPTLRSRHGRGKDLFEPATRIAIEGGPIRVTNPGSRERWDLRPTWHGTIYGNGKPGDETQSVVGPDALRAYPISPRTAETKKPDTKSLRRM
jgi:hypothetical protein